MRRVSLPWFPPCLWNGGCESRFVEPNTLLSTPQQAFPGYAGPNQMNGHDANRVIQTRARQQRLGDNARQHSYKSKRKDSL